MKYNGVKVFSVSKHKDRLALSDTVTTWLRESGVEVVDKVVCQSSDVGFHCISIVVFYHDAPVKKRTRRRGEPI